VRFLTLSIAFCLIPAAFADTVNIGFLALSPAFPAGDQFVIGNETGTNASAFPSTLFPVITSVSFSDLMLTVNFFDHTAQTFTNFALAADGLSFIGQDLFDLGATPIASAILTGTLDTTAVTFNDGSHGTLLADFAAILTNPSGMLQENDFAFLTADTASSAVPEPTMGMLLAFALAALAAARCLRVHGLRSRLRVAQNFVGPVGLL
jgi:hypothetical protein